MGTCQLSFVARTSLRAAPLVAPLAVLLTGLGLPACGAFLSFGDGIPNNGTTSSIMVDNGHMHTVVAWGVDGIGYRFEWDGQQRPGVAPGDDDFAAIGNGELILGQFEDGSKVAELVIAADGLSETRHFTVAGQTRPFEPDGALWLATAMPQLINHLGLGASSRVPRLMAEGGLDAVLADISLRETNLALNIYFEYVIEDTSLSSDDVARVVRQAGRELDSNAQIADLLEEAIEARPGDSVVLDAVLAAASSLSSNAHLADVLETAVEEGAASGRQLETLLILAGSSISSNAHLADVLESVAQRGDLADVASPAFADALAHISSDAHAADVLEDLVANPRLTSATLASLLTHAAPGIGSDAHLADVLDEVPAARLQDDAVRAGFLVALATIDSDAHAADVLEDFVDRCSDPRVLTDLVQAAGAGISSDAHLADVLENVAPAAVSDSALRSALRAALATIDSRAHRASVRRSFPDGALDR